MLVHEAILVANILDSLAPKHILDIGSGPRYGRDIVQPHIGAAFRGHSVTWTDLADTPGTIQCDITDAESLAGLPRCEMVTCLSVLEHVTDRDMALRNLLSLVNKWLVVSVPYVYPPHDVPIDNGWRPSADDLSDAVERNGLEVVRKYETLPEQFGGIDGCQASLVFARR